MLIFMAKFIFFGLIKSFLKDSERQQVSQLQALKNEIAAGKASGKALVANSVFDRLQAKYAQQATGQAL